MSNITQEQAVEWLDAIEKNFVEFRKKTRLNKVDKIKYIEEQYATLYLLNRAINGEVVFVGAKQIFR